MAYAAPDPKRVEADRARVRQRELDDIAAIERERHIKQEIRACYYEGSQILNGTKVIGYSPKQIKHAGEMIRNGQNIDTLHEAHRVGKACWEVLGRSHGGRTRGKLMRCAYI